MHNYFILSDLWVYDLSDYYPRKKDERKAKEYNLLSRCCYYGDGHGEWVVIGAYNRILDFISEYLECEDYFANGDIYKSENMKYLRDVL